MPDTGGPNLVEVPRPIPIEKLDPDAVRIVRRLTEAGFPAYLVGGCVRDLLFGLKPKDFDIATSAEPRQIRRLFRNCRIIGRRFRLAHVFFRDKIIEVATFRAGAPVETPEEVEAVETAIDAAEAEAAAMLAADGPAAAAEAEVDASDELDAGNGNGHGERHGHGDGDGDGDGNGNGNGIGESGLIIRDDNVFGTAEQDAVRRDFTFNALFYDVDRQVILDHVGGVADVERKQVRTIGDARIRMREDPIRMLRAIRLAARMGCRIHEDTWQAIKEFRHEILHAAAPRIGEDILRMFRGGAIRPAVEMMRDSGVLEVLLPELERLIAANPAEYDALRTVLEIADARTQAGTALTAPVQFSLLLAPVLMTPSAAVAGGGAGAEPGPAADADAAAGADTGAGAGPSQGAPRAVRPVGVNEAGERLKPILARLAISRRDSERMRQVLFTLPKMIPPPAGRKRRASAPLVRRAFFPEAVDVFEILALATGDCRDEAARWRRKLAEAGPPPPETPRKRPAHPRGQGGGGGGTPLRGGGTPRRDGATPARDGAAPERDGGAPDREGATPGREGGRTPRREGGGRERGGRGRRRR